MTADTNREVSIVIYPFANLTGRQELDPFCESFYVDLLTEFSRFRQFRIIPHDLMHDAQIVPEYSFKGMFRYHNDLLKFNAQLINVPGNFVTWADWHELEKEAINSIQQDLLKQVITVLQLQVNYDLLRQVRKKSPAHLTAYEHWLSGMSELQKGTLQGDENARDHFQQAIHIDATYSLAYSGMSLTYFNEWTCQLWERWDVSQKGAYEWARKAIELDENNYIAALVLGRIHIFEAQYDIGEHYIRKALRLNPNDTDCRMQIATCFIYLGYLDEAQALYDRAPNLEQIKHKYLQVGAFIALEKGEFEKCVALGANALEVWVDFPAMMASAYFELGDLDNMHRYWNIYLSEFRKKILKDPDSTDELAPVQWHINVCPFRSGTRLRRFWEYMSKEKATLSRSFVSVIEEESRNIFQSEGELWHISYGSKTIHMRDAKGLHDIATMLREPGKQFHCTELMKAAAQLEQVLVFDEKARRSYQKRIHELQEEIQSSEKMNDGELTSTLQKEYDDLIDHLKIAIGLKGKTRNAHDPVEKVRSAVTWRIRNVITKMEKNHPDLARHLGLAIKTGTFCSYNPEKKVDWVLD